MIKYKIVVASLSGCGTCKELKDTLIQNNIQFVDVPCDKDPQLCDQIESITKSAKYPMVVIKDLTQNLDYIYFKNFNYNELGKENIIDSKIRTVGFFSNQEILNKIKSL